MTNINYRLPPIQLSETILFSNEGIIGKEIQILRAGKFVHDQEEFEITLADLQSMVDNFNSRARRIDIMLDYEHKSDSKAAAWFKEVYLQNDNELWGRVEWTDRGAESVKRKEYRYISADFNYNYVDNETLQEYGPTLFGAALTNRPVVKGMVPTILSEQYNKTYPKEDEMKTVEELTKANAELQAKYDELSAKLEPVISELAEIKKVNEELVLAEKKASDEKKLAEEKEAKEKVISDKKAKFDLKLSEGSVCEAQRDGFMNDDMEDFLAKATVVKMKTDGSNLPAGDDKKEVVSAQSQVMELSEKKAKELNISLGEAIKKVLSENKELSEKRVKELEEV